MLCYFSNGYFLAKIKMHLIFVAKNLLQNISWNILFSNFDLLLKSTLELLILFKFWQQAISSNSWYTWFYVVSQGNSKICTSGMTYILHIIRITVFPLDDKFVFGDILFFWLIFCNFLRNERSERSWRAEGAEVRRKSRGPKARLRFS